MHQCDYCCWYNNRQNGCDCPSVMKARACEKAKSNKLAKKTEVSYNVPSDDLEELIIQPHNS